MEEAVGTRIHPWKSHSISVNGYCRLLSCSSLLCHRINSDSVLPFKDFLHPGVLSSFGGCCKLREALRPSGLNTGLKGCRDTECVGMMGKSPRAPGNSISEHASNLPASMWELLCQAVMGHTVCGMQGGPCSGGSSGPQLPKPKLQHCSAPRTAARHARKRQRLNAERVQTKAGYSDY